MLLLTFSNADIKFAEKNLTWKFHTTKKALPTTWKVVLINKKKFAKVALDKNIEVFIVYIALFILKMTIYLACKAQMTLFISKEVTVLVEYTDFANIFSKTLAAMLSKRLGINKHIIKLVDGKMPPYGPMYSLAPVELKILKTYIETNLANSFIKSLKSLAGTLILFVCKPDGSFCLCINYQRPNNLTIKNSYPLLLIDKSLDWLKQAKRFTQLDFISTYHRIRIKKYNKW